MKNIKTIIHTADIHIRNIKRHSEYRYVFESFYTKIREITKRDQQQPIVVVAGDIVHSKTEISPELIQMVSEFIINLCTLSSVCIVIPGNHDANLNNESRLDTLTPILAPLQREHHNLYYWKQNGVYSIENIDFAVMSLLDEESTYPKATDCRLEAIKIALYHGALNASVVDSGLRLDSNTKLSMFNGFDMALLGDIHKFQYLNPECTIAYPSSLIQQNFGEDFYNHGFIEWDVNTKQGKFCQLDNLYGYFTIEIDQDAIVNKIPVLTRKNRIRVKASRSSAAGIKQIVDKIAAQYNLNIDDISISQSITDTVISVTDKLVEGDLRNPVIQNQLIRQHLVSKSYKPNVIKKITAIHSSISTELNSKENIHYLSWKPIRFEFSNMFSYGENNVIDFTTLKGLYGIFGPNASGKSSVLDAWCFCMFDECARTYKADKIMNINKNNFYCKFEFEQGGKRYFIEKRAKRLTGYWEGKVKVDVDFWVEDLDHPDERKILNGDRRQETVRIIEEYLGSFKDFTLTTLSTQIGGNVNFIQKTQSERKDVLAQYLGLSVFEQPYDLANKRLNKICSSIEIHSTKNYDQLIQETQSEIEEITNMLSINETQITDISNQLLSITEQIEAKTSLLPLKQDSVPYDETALKSSMQKLQNLIFTTKKELEATEQKIELKQNLISDTKQLMLSKKNLATCTRNIKRLEDVRSNHSELLSQLQSIQNEIAIVNEKLDHLGNVSYDPNCSYCMNNVFVINALEAKAKLPLLQDQQKQLIDQINASENEICILTVFEEQMIEHTKQKHKYNTITSELKLLEERQNSASNLLEGFNAKIELIETQLEQIKKFHADHAASLLLIADINGYKVQQELLIKQERELIQKQSEYVSQLKIKTHTEKQLKEQQHEYHQLLIDKELYEIYLSAIDRNGVPHDLIKKAIPLLQQRVNDILAQMVDFGMVLFMEDKEINAFIVYEDKHWPLEMTSGMERFISSIALRVALLQVSTLPKPNILVIDEGFGVLDSNNTNSLHMLFSNLKELFDAVIIVSHIDSIKDLVDNTILIEPKDGYSFVHVEYL